MKKLIYFSTMTLLFVFISSICMGQFYFEENFKDLDLLKKSTIYVAIDQDAHINNPEYAKIFQDYWKFSTIEIIEPKEIGRYLKEGNFFFTLSVMYESGFDMDRPAPLQEFMLTLWTPNPDYLKKIQKKNDPDMDIDFKQLANKLGGFKFVFDKSGEFKIGDVMKGEYFGNGYQLYTGLGIFKNQVQNSQIYLDLIYKKALSNLNLSKQELRKEERRKMFDLQKSVVLNCNKAEVKKLKNKILYIPSGTLIDNSGFTLNNYKKNKKPALKASSVFFDYPGKYQVINIKALNEKILNNEEAFYYITIPENFMIIIVNSQTGEIIFKEDNVGCDNKICPELLETLIDEINSDAE